MCSWGLQPKKAWIFMQSASRAIGPASCKAALCICQSNQLHVDILQFSFIKFKYIL